MKKTVTILHTNDLHSTFLGIGPASDYTPFSLNDDQTVGGYARLATLIRQRRKAREAQGPVLVLDAGDFAMGTAFAAATRETGCELRLMARMGFDATTFGNHEFDYGPDGIARSIGVAVDAGRAPPIVAANADFRAEDPRLAGLQGLVRRGAIRPHLVLDRGYRAIDVTGQDQTLYGVGCNLMLGLIIVAIPKQTQGKLGLVPKGRDGRPLQSRGEALVVPRSATASLLPPQGTIDHTSVVDAPAGPGRREVREWQAIMDALVRLPRKNADGVSVLAVDERLAETRAIDVARGV